MINSLKAAVGAVTLACLFVAPIGHADEQPYFVTFTGTVFDLAVDSNGDGIFANVVQAQSQGSFGPTMTAVVSEYRPFPPKFGTCPIATDVYAIFMYSTAITTFKNGDQLDAVAQEGWLCFDMETGVFEGEISGEFNGGTGRFAKATGTWVASFTGKDYMLELLLPAAAERIDGVIEGTINLH